MLGPSLFALYTGDLLEAVSSASLYTYADNTTIYCIGESVDSVTNTLNNALKELEKIGVQRTTWFPTPISVKQLCYYEAVSQAHSTLSHCAITP